MAFVNVWIHVVWGTKNRSPVLSKEIRNTLFTHIKQNALANKIHIDCIDGYTDHVHCLIGLNADMSIAKTAQMIKGEAASWANKQKLLPTKLYWADGYFAISVSESMVNKVRDYIKNQENHHKKITYQQEYDSFMEKYGFNHG